MIPDGWHLESDFRKAKNEKFNKENNKNDTMAMSVDQVVYFFAGLLAVSKWTDNVENKELASLHCRNIMQYLISRGYHIDTTPPPISRTIPDTRGPHYEWACGYLSEIASYVTKNDYLGNKNNIVRLEVEIPVPIPPLPPEVLLPKPVPVTVIKKLTAKEAHDAVQRLLSLDINSTRFTFRLKLFGFSYEKEVSVNSSPLAMVRFILATSSTTRAEDMKRFSDMGHCPWSMLLYCVFHNKVVPDNLMTIARDLLSQMPDSGPSSQLAKENDWEHPWGKECHFIRSLQLRWSTKDREDLTMEFDGERKDGVERYNGLDYLMLVGLLKAVESE